MERVERMENVHKKWFVRAARAISESKIFQHFILTMIVLAGALVGLETYPALSEAYAGFFHWADIFVIWLFAAEAGIKILACGNEPQKYFKDPWNLFDFFIVIVCFLPFGGHYAAVLRLVRIARVLRLITALPKLQLIVGALLKSIPAMTYISMLMMVLFYVYAAIGTMFFHLKDPSHFGSLHQSMLTLFKVITLEGWVEVMNVQMHGSNTAAIIAVGYFVSFILLGTMLMLNLVIGVVVNSMEEVQIEENAKRNQAVLKQQQRTVADEMRLLIEQIDGMKSKLQMLTYQTEEAMIEASVDNSEEKVKESKKKKSGLTLPRPKQIPV